MADVQTAVPQQKPQKSWFGRNWWWVLLLVIIGLGLICAGLCTGIACWSFRKARNSEAYAMTFDAVSKDPMVLERLGEPIQEPPIVGGSVGGSDAFLVFPITGPNGTASVESQGHKVNDKWALTEIKVTFPDGKEHLVPLGEKQAGGLDEAPLFVPPGEVPQDPTNP